MVGQKPSTTTVAQARASAGTGAGAGAGAATGAGAGKEGGSGGPSDLAADLSVSQRMRQYKAAAEKERASNVKLADTLFGVVRWVVVRDGARKRWGE